MNSETTAEFWNEYAKLDSSLKRSARKAFLLWRDNPFHPLQKEITLAKDQQGTVIDFAPDTGVIKIECTDGTIFEGTVHLSSSTELTDIESIGFWKSKYRLPKSLNLLAIMDKVEGQRVRVRTYLDEFHNEFAMIWFLDR